MKKKQYIKAVKKFCKAYYVDDKGKCLQCGGYHINFWGEDKRKDLLKSYLSP